MDTIKRTRLNLGASRLWIIMMSQPTKPKSMISNRTPKISLKKTSSFSKKACARNVPLIKKYRMKAAIPIAGDFTFKFM